MAVTEVKVPDIGDFTDVEIIEVLVSAGDSVEAEDPLITLETDKASMDVPAPQAGTVKELKVQVGDKVSEGSLILLLDSEAASGSAPPASDDSGAKAAETDTKAEPQPDAEPVAAKPQEVEVPDIGDFKDVEVIEVHVGPGDSVEAEDPLLTLESDKASMEVPSPAAGTIQEFHIKVGDKVSQGTLIALLAPAGAPAPAKPADKPAQPAAAEATPDRSPEQRPPPPAPEPAAKTSFAKVHASPSVRRFARELGVDLTQVKGSGRKERITQEDVQKFVKQALSGGAPGAAAAAGGMGIPPIPAVDFSKFGEVEEQPLGRIQKLSGPHLHRSWLNVPMVTQFDEADSTELEAFRKSLKAEAEKHGVRVTALAFIMKAVAQSLREFPRFNSSLAPDGQSLILKKYCHLGIAVDTPNGLVVPVFRDVDQKSIFELSGELGEMSKKARDGKLSPNDMQGGCFSISSLGGIGGTMFTPIVNAPEVAILGVSRAQYKPVWNEAKKEFVPRLMLPLALTYDHRVIDGALGARFIVYLSALLGDIRRLLL